MIKNKPKGLPPTAPPQKLIPSMPSSSRNKEVKGLQANPSDPVVRTIKSRKGAKAQRVNPDGIKKKRRNPKTTEPPQIEPKVNRYQMYRALSREHQENPIEPIRYANKL
jgi:hypothetical protein